MRAVLSIFFTAVSSFALWAESPRVFPDNQRPNDNRLSDLRNLNGYFPLKPISDSKQWPDRQAEIKRRILLSQGLWPMPARSDLNAVVHGRVEREDYVVDRVFFESIPGHFVTGSLYRPKGKQGPYPAILSPHGHWKDGRFYDAGETHIRGDLAQGAERYELGGRYPIQARAVQLARMGCLVFIYDMTGNADSIQIGHRPDQTSHLDRPTDWGFFSTQAELRLHNMMGLQSWNSIRAVDFLLELEDTDPSRIGVTGASGGGTQSMILGAIDERIAAAMPCVMVSTSMQGGCTCENASYLRIDQGNIDIAAAIAPRPLGLTAADDWTVELRTKGYPGLQQLYSDLGHQDRLTAAFNIHFTHNYNQVNRSVMYGFFSRHFNLGFDEPVLERDFTPLAREEATVWTNDYPAPSGNAIGETHEVQMLRIAAKDSAGQIEKLIPENPDQYEQFQHVVGGAWETILGRSLDQVQAVTFQKTNELDRQGLSIVLGSLNHAGEQLPYVQIRKQDVANTGTANQGIVIVISDQGKTGLFDGDGVTPMVADLVGAGYTVVSADLFQQGEFSADGSQLESQRMWFQPKGEVTWKRFSGYTFGYNHPLFVKRVHDVLTVIKRVSSNPEREVHLIGIGAQAGPIVVAARSQAGDALERTFVDSKGFRFAELTRQDDPMFVPGAVKYLGVDGLLSLCLPHQINVVGNSSSVVNRVAEAIESKDSIQWHASNDDLQRAIRESLISR